MLDIENNLTYHWHTKRGQVSAKRSNGNSAGNTKHFAYARLSCIERIAV
jgi:hypothetical protein